MALLSPITAPITLVHMDRINQTLTLIQDTLQHLLRRPTSRIASRRASSSAMYIAAAARVSNKGLAVRGEGGCWGVAGGLYSAVQWRGMTGCGGARVLGSKGAGRRGLASCGVRLAHVVLWVGGIHKYTEKLASSPLGLFLFYLTNERSRASYLFTSGRGLCRMRRRPNLCPIEIVFL